MSYLKFLQALIALGPKLLKILPALQAFIDAISDAFPAAETGSLEMTAVSTAEAEAETQVASLLAGPNAAFDGSRLRGLWKRLEASGLADVLVSLLLAKLAGG